MDEHDLELVRETIVKVLARCAPADVPGALLESGWRELADEDVVAVSALFEVHGRMRAVSPALDLVALGALGLPLASDVAVVYPIVERDDCLAAGAVDKKRLHVDGLLLAGSERARRLVVALADPDGGCAEIAMLDPSVLELVRLEGFDPSLGLVRVSGELDASTAERSRAKSPLAVIVATCRVALASELLGIAECLFDLTVEQVTSRPMFGRMLASMQSVQHRVADMVVEISALRATLGALGPEPEPLGGQVAKAVAGRCALLVAKHAQQLGGAIGFTEEHGLPGALRRVHALDTLLGSSRRLQVEIGVGLLGSGTVPRLFPI